MSAETNRTVTPRGFTGYDEFTDTYGSKIRVQQSSSAEGPRVWIFAEGRQTHADVSPHLDVEQAKRLRNALDAFIAEHTGGCPDHPEGVRG